MSWNDGCLLLIWQLILQYPLVQRFFPREWKCPRTVIQSGIGNGNSWQNNSLYYKEPDHSNREYLITTKPHYNNTISHSHTRQNTTKPHYASHQLYTLAYSLTKKVNDSKLQGRDKNIDPTRLPKLEGAEEYFKLDWFLRKFYMN